MYANVVSLACEFPNDNPALHRGTVWVCRAVVGPAEPERVAGWDVTELEAEEIEPSILVEELDPVEASLEGPASVAPGLKQSLVTQPEVPPVARVPLVEDVTGGAAADTEPEVGAIGEAVFSTPTEAFVGLGAVDASTEATVNAAVAAPAEVSVASEAVEPLALDVAAAPAKCEMVTVPAVSEAVEPVVNEVAAEPVAVEVEGVSRGEVASPVAVEEVAALVAVEEVAAPPSHRAVEEVAAPVSVEAVNAPMPAGVEPVSIDVAARADLVAPEAPGAESIELVVAEAAESIADALAAPIPPAPPSSAVVVVAARNAEATPADGLEDAGPPTLTFEEVQPAPLPIASTALPPAPDDPFTVLVCTLADVAIGAGSPHVASLLPALFFDGRIEGPLDPAVAKVLVEGGLLESPSATVVAPSFAARASAWKSILRGTSDDFTACGAAMLDEWGAEVLAKLLDTPGRTPSLRQELRSRGVAAFGLVEAAA